MKKEVAPRAYRMKARAEAAAQTARDILTAASDLWREKGMDDITLQDIAERAGVTVQTVLRRFKSKEGVIAACLETDVAGIQAERDTVPAGDVEQALETLLEHYERDGDAVLRTLALEHKLKMAKAIAVTGRQAHRRWCARVFTDYLPQSDTQAYEKRLDAFVAATDIYLWKLLRRDVGRSPQQTKRVLGVLVQGLIATKEG